MIIDLNVKARKELKKQTQGLLQEGIVPGVVYGPEVEENINVSVDINTLEKVYSEGGESTMINLQVEGEKEAREVLIKAIKFDPVIDRPTHVDFYQIKRGQMLDIEPELEFIGESPAVKALGGVLVKSLASIQIRCLPRHMTSSIQVDISSLATFEDKILVKDLNLSEGVELLTDPEEVVAGVQEPREEEVDEPVAAEEGEEAKAEEGSEAKPEAAEDKSAEDKKE